MNKKQAAIIVTLLVLIVCAGYLASKVNGPLYVNDTELGGGSANSFNQTDKQNSKKSDYFAETRLIRDQKSNVTTQTLKNIIDDKNVSKESKDNAVKKYTEITVNSNNETRIESILKGKGFDDVVCLIEDDKARIIVKSKEKLTDKQIRQIQDVVMSVAKIRNVEIDIKQ